MQSLKVNLQSTITQKVNFRQNTQSMCSPNLIQAQDLRSYSIDPTTISLTQQKSYSVSHLLGTVTTDYMVTGQ